MSLIFESSAAEQITSRDPRDGSAALVTIVIAVFNRLQFLDQAIRSALGQSYPHIQVIVVDDGSEIDVSPVISKHQDRVELVRKRNGGVARRGTLGCNRAQGQFILFLDDDDFLESSAVATLLAAIESQPATRWAAGTCVYVDEVGLTLPGRRGHVFQSGDVYEQMIFRCLMSCPSSVIMQTDVVRELGGFDEGLCPSEDYDLWLCWPANFQSPLPGPS